MSDEPREPWTLTRFDVASQIGVHPDTVRDWCRKGLISFMTLPSGARRFRQSDIDAFVALRRS